MFWGVPGTYRVTGRGSGHPRQKIWALWAKRGNAPATRGWCAPRMGRPKEEKERGEGKCKCGLGFPLPSLPPLSSPLRQTWQGGAAKGRSPSRIQTYLGRPLASPLTIKKYTSVRIRVCHSRSRFLSCMYIHDDFMTESR